MYIPKHFGETNLDVIQALMSNYPLSTLVTLSADGLNANHIPLHWVDTSIHPDDASLIIIKSLWKRLRNASKV